MHIMLAAVTIAGAAPAAAAALAAPVAAPPPAVMVPIATFLAAFNKGDVGTAATAMVAGGGAIVDEFAPHYWSGRTATAAWAADHARDATARGVSDGNVVLGPPTRSEVGATTAYVITPARYTFRLKGVATVEDGSLTFVVVKAKAWKIAAWTWSGPPPTPLK